MLYYKQNALTRLMTYSTVYISCKVIMLSTMLLAMSTIYWRVITAAATAAARATRKCGYARTRRTRIQ